MKISSFLAGNFKKINDKYCDEADFYHYYFTFKSAQNACITDSNCLGIYDKFCNGKLWHLCPIWDTYRKSWGGSCIFEKMEGES